VLALAAAPTDLSVRAVVEAGRGRWATALYRNCEPIGGALLATIDELIALINTETVVIGELHQEARSKLEMLPRVRLAPRSASARRAGYLAELGWRMAQGNEPGDARLLDALYIT
jgi:tRNA A37 threonylcarbamoyladenosine modification protein TsaB